jgi:hypothetical protein
MRRAGDVEVAPEITIIDVEQPSAEAPNRR